MTVCESCKKLCDGLGPYCQECEDEIEIVECANECGEKVNYGGFCSTACRLEYEDENGMPDYE